MLKNKFIVIKDQIKPEGEDTTAETVASVVISLESIVKHGVSVGVAQDDNKKLLIICGGQHMTVTKQDNNNTAKICDFFGSLVKEAEEWWLTPEGKPKTKVLAMIDGMKK